MDLTNALLVLKQVVILFLLIGAGYLARKLKMVEDTGLRQMTNILLVIVMPCVVIHAFQIPYEAAMLQGLLISFAAAVAMHLVSALIAGFLFRRQPEAQAKVLRFTIIFTNCGYFTLPLLDAVVGSRGVFYGSVFIAVFNIVAWTYGVLLMTGKKGEINLRHALVNPGTVAIAIALPIYLLQIQLPSVVSTVVGQLAAINSPLAMLIIGGQLAVVPLRSLFLNRQVYVASFFRLLVVPLLMIAALQILGLDRELILSCLLPAAAPSAALAGLFAMRYDQDVPLATHVIAFSTIFSIISIPLLIVVSDLAGRLLHG
jgi:malate permease and related proteins